MRGLQLIVAFNYGARDEIVRAARAARRAGRARRDSGPRRSTTRLFEQALDTAGIPDPDLIVRTSGEQRISNFLLWQARLCRADLPAGPLAGFRRRAVRGGAHRNSPRANGATEASLASEQAVCRAAASELRTRIVSAVVLAPVALAGSDPRRLAVRAARDARRGDRLLGMDGDQRSGRAALASRWLRWLCLAVGLLALALARTDLGHCC